MVFLNGKPEFTEEDLNSFKLIEMPKNEKAQIEDKYFLRGVGFSIILVEMNVIGIMLAGGGKYALVDKELAPVYLLLLLVQIFVLCTALRMRCKDKVSIRKIEGYLEKKDGYEDGFVWSNYFNGYKVKRVYAVVMRDRNSNYSTRVYVNRHIYKNAEVGDELSLAVKWSDE